MSDDFKCRECGAPIIIYQKYWKHKDGTILCTGCFDKLLKEGKIK